MTGERGTDPASWVCSEHPDVALVAADILEEFSDRAPLLGSILGGKYHLIDILGRGGFGAVYRGLQAPVGRAVAVKVIRERELRGDSASDVRGRFMREARVISSLRHHATVKLHDFGEDDDVLFMVLELVEGQTLHRVLGTQGPMAPTRAVAIMVQVLEALAEAHAKGMVHRDLKPGNVMLSRSPFGHDRVKVLDFGIAKIVDTGPGDGVETSRGVVFGSPAYMAPEQAQGHPQPASDLYAAGVMLYEMLTGVRPFYGENEVQTVLAHIRAPVPDGMEKAGVPQALADVVRHALAKTPEERIASAQRMANALQQAVNLEPIEDEATIVNLPSNSLRLDAAAFNDDTLVNPTPTTGTETFGEALQTMDDPMSAQMRLERYRRRGRLWGVVAGLVGFAVVMYFAFRQTPRPAARLTAPATDATPTSTAAPQTVPIAVPTAAPISQPASMVLEPVDLREPVQPSSAAPTTVAAPESEAPKTVASKTPAPRKRPRKRRWRKKRPRAPASKSTGTDGWL
jgi:serine/threonine-protein kinase